MRLLSVTQLNVNQLHAASTSEREVSSTAGKRPHSAAARTSDPVELWAPDTRRWVLPTHHHLVPVAGVRAEDSRQPGGSRAGAGGGAVRWKPRLAARR